MTSIEGDYISADGHFVEPADLWLQRMDRRFRDRAPRVESRDNADWYVIEGVTAFPVGLEGASMEDKIAGEIKMMGGRRHAGTRPGAWDPQARIADLKLGGEPNECNSKKCCVGSRLWTLVVSAVQSLSNRRTLRYAAAVLGLYKRNP